MDRYNARRAVLSLLPLGTANDVARTLGIPTNLDINDGTLDVYAIAGAGWRDLAGAGWRDLAGLALSFRGARFVHRANVHTDETAAGRIDTERTLATNVDGELVDQMLLLFTQARDALGVLVPRDSTAAD